MTDENTYLNERYNKDRLLSIIPSKKPEGTSKEDWYSIDNDYPYIGIDTALFFTWAAKKNFLDEKIEKPILTILNTIETYTHQNILDLMLNSIGHIIWGYHFKEDSKYFCMDYLQYFIWKYDIHEDVKETLFPQLRTISEIPETNETYDKIFKLFDKRYEAHKEQA